MIDTVTGWSKITQYDNKRVTTIAKLVETTWLTRYLKPMEITYDQGSEFIGNEYIKSLIEKEYKIHSNQSTLEKPTSNAIFE